MAKKDGMIDGMQQSLTLAAKLLKFIETTPLQRNLVKRRIRMTLKLYAEEYPIAAFTGLSREVVASIVASVVEDGGK